ncbi:MAG: hypothetical protein EZS28_030756 [Streblomastix strix]|uniref:Protein kinase domain-containing protein n=1 Tax=Streblomastix strix TaxID=222440 RepID=A0A5J4UTL5_9EUKA|nr:MAG: hypothetical protein EZS28_030756 [Streblomastix strix]
MIEKQVSTMKNSYGIVHQSTSSYIHIVQPLGFFLNDEGDKAYLVMEYCEGGDLRRYIHKLEQSGTMISPQKAYEIIGQIALGLDQLHFNGRTHGNLKPENILMTNDFMIKLADYGQSRVVQVNKYQTAMNYSYQEFYAPELLKSQNKHVQTPACDIWAFGIIIFLLLTQHHPFYGKQGIHEYEFIHRIISQEPAELPDQYPIQLRNLIKQMLNKDPQRRIIAQEIISMPEIATALQEVRNRAEQLKLNDQLHIEAPTISSSQSMVNNRQVRISNIPENIDEHDIQQFAQQFGEIQKIEFQTQAQGRLRTVIKVKKVGQGSFGKVFHIQEITSSEIMVWKKMDYFNTDDKLMVNNEVNMIIDAYDIFYQSTSSQIPVVQPLGFFLNNKGNKAYLILEYCEGGDLQKFIQDLKDKNEQITDEV